MDRRRDDRNLPAKIADRSDEQRFAFRVWRRVRQRPGFLLAAVIVGLAAGLAYRALFDPAGANNPVNFLRSAAHGGSVGLTAWAVQTVFDSRVRSRLGAALSRLPLAAEIAVRALVMTAALIVVGILLQLVLYAAPLRLNWLTQEWLVTTLPRIVAIGFGISFVTGAMFEARRLIGGPLLTSVLLGTYHRPVRRELIVMFLDLAQSTRLAEAMGELKVHDLITRFFYDIDGPISDFGGAVHAYVGDEVIVSWPVKDDPALNARPVGCFFAIERTIRRLAPDYEREFGATPGFRAGLHAGSVVVSECGDAKRQLAFFGDTMNVAARLCDYCKATDARLVTSGDLKGLIAIPADCAIGECEIVTPRGRREPVEAYPVRERTSPVASDAAIGNRELTPPS
jgi:adenylate cyclase